jgi:hypothetical protein
MKENNISLVRNNGIIGSLYVLLNVITWFYVMVMTYSLVQMFPLMSEHVFRKGSLSCCTPSSPQSCSDMTLVPCSALSCSSWLKVTHASVAERHFKPYSNVVAWPATMIPPQPPALCSAFPKGPTSNVASQGSRWVCLYFNFRYRCQQSVL